MRIWSLKRFHDLESWSFGFMNKVIQIYLLGAFVCSYALNSAASLCPGDLRCEYQLDPGVVDASAPHLGWINHSVEDDRNKSQTAWQIRVSRSRDDLETPDKWDSGKVISDQHHKIRYHGDPLNSQEECWWQVRVWDEKGEVSEWSEPAFWRMGLLKKDDWIAKWIGAPWQGEDALEKPGYPDGKPEDFGPPAPMFRKSFDLQKHVQKAVLFTTGLGYFECRINGEKISEDVLVPNQTNYGKRPDLANQNIPLSDDFHGYKVMYLAYDITDKLQKGENVLGYLLGNGFYNPAKYWADGYGSPRFIAQLHLTFEDGTEQMVVSDPSWQVARSPILMNMVYYGETYDARLDQDGWDGGGFDASGWESAIIRNAPFGDLVAHTAATDRISERFNPIRIYRNDAGNTVVEFPREISGWLALKGIRAASGHTIKIHFNSSNFSGENTYICSGEGVESYTPRFNWFVFKSVEIENWPGTLSEDQIEALSVHTQLEETSEFVTSNRLFNRIHEIWVDTQVANVHGNVPSDCPHRERSGYTGDGQVVCSTVMSNFDARSFYQKWIRDIRDAQIVATGYIPNGAPWQSGCGGGVAWGAAICILPWEYYLSYDDKDMLFETYEAMKGYVHYLETWKTDHGTVLSRRKGNDGQVLQWFNLGEWATPGLLPPDELVHTFYAWMCQQLTANTAEVLGHLEESLLFASMAAETRKAFNATFYDSENQTYGDAGANVFALHIGVPADREAAVLRTLESTFSRNEGNLDTGIFGTRYLFETLSQYGLGHLAYTAMNQQDSPSPGYWIEQGSTTMWEHWDGKGSHNHPMFGGGIVWFYQQLAGMRPDPESPGYRNILFAPEVIRDLQFVRYSNETINGKAGINWQWFNDHLEVETVIPVGSTAELRFPDPDPSSITESGIPIIGHPDIREVVADDSCTRILLGSGSWRFQN